MGADTALPLLRQILLGMPRLSARESAPAGVARVDICWPLGRAAAYTAPGECARRRSAWVVDGRVPPTLTAPAESAAWMAQVDVRFDPATATRLSLDCAPGTGVPTRIARWPRELAAWLDPALSRAQALPPLRADCAADGLDMLDSMRIHGLPERAHLRALPGSRRGPSASLYVDGTDGPVRWMVNGRLEATLAANQRFMHRFAERGPSEVLALADHGRYARLQVSVD
jgi:penicillin-binding protein 1C